MSMRKLLRRSSLYDKPFIDAGFNLNLKPGTTLRKLLAEAVHVRCQNVADYYWALDKEQWKIADFPNLAPPWPVTWLEWTEPSHRISTPSTESGMLVISWELTGAGREYWPNHLDREPGEYNRWGSLAITFMQMWSGKITAGATAIDVSSHGRGMGSDITPDGRQAFSSCLLTPTGDKQLDKSLSDGLFVTMNVGLMTISFANCSNVPQLTERQGWKPRHANAKPKHGEEPVTWHVLDIGIPKAVLAQHGVGSGTGLKKALHLARGHFKTYTEARPLMGKATGTYWWRPQIRGKDQSRIALKDYNVNPEEN